MENKESIGGETYPSADAKVLRRAWAEKDYEWIIKLWREGLSAAAIGRKLGMDTAHVSAAVTRIRAAGVDLPRRKGKRPDADALNKLGS